MTNEVTPDMKELIEFNKRQMPQDAYLSAYDTNPNPGIVSSMGAK